MADRKHTTSELLELGAPIVGTPLALIARDAVSPRAAARAAFFLGYGFQLAQATRWAAIIAMRERNGDEKPGTFEQFFGPFEDNDYGDLPDMRQKTLIQVEHFCKDEMRWQPLNPVELKEIIDQLHSLSKERGLRIVVISNPGSKENPACLECGYACLIAVSGLNAPPEKKSRWPSKPHWEKDKK